MSTVSNFHSRVYFEAGSHRLALQQLKAEGIQRVAVISDDITQKQGKLALLQGTLSELGLAFDTYIADPFATYEAIFAQAQQINSQTYDCYLSLGGNFLNFAAKIAWVLAENPGFDVTQLDTDFAQAQVAPKHNITTGRRAIHIAIPAAYMLGGEFGPYVLTRFASGEAGAYLNPSLLPTRLVLDPTLLTTVSPEGLAAEGFDSLTHCIECYLRDSEQPLVKAACLQGAAAIYQYLPALLANQEDLHTRAQVQAGLWGASVAFTNLFSGVVHSMTTMYTGRFSVPHGAAHALTLPVVLEFMAQQPAAGQRVRQLAAHLQVAAVDDPQAPHKLAMAIKAFAERIGLPTQVQAAGITREQFLQALPEMADGAAHYQSTRLSPVVADTAQIKSLYEAALG